MGSVTLAEVVTLDPRLPLQDLSRRHSVLLAFEGRQGVPRLSDPGRRPVGVLPWTKAT